VANWYGCKPIKVLSGLLEQQPLALNKRYSFDGLPLTAWTDICLARERDIEQCFRFCIGG
jgi:hypothetical protein